MLRLGFSQYLLRELSYAVLICCYLACGVSADILDLRQNDIAPGIIHHRLVKQVPGGQVIANILEVDLARGYTIKPALADVRTIWSRKQLKDIVLREGAVAGINASYFNNQSGMPIGALAIQGEWITGPIYQRATLSVSQDGRVRFDRLELFAKASVYRSKSPQRQDGFNMLARTGSVKPTRDAEEFFYINSVNQPDSLNPRGICYYNYWWQRAVPCGGERACLLVDAKGTVIRKLEVQASPEGLYPSRDDYIVSARNNVIFENVAEGDSVQLVWTSKPNLSNIVHAIGGGPLLLAEGRIVLNSAGEKFTADSGIGGRAPRTAVGLTAGGRIVMLTADGRQEDSIGLTLGELAALMKEIGVVDAINFDGGGSSAMVVNGDIVNHPSDKAGPRPISTALLVYPPSSQAPVEYGRVYESL